MGPWESLDFTQTGTKVTQSEDRNTITLDQTEYADGAQGDLD